MEKYFVEAYEKIYPDVSKGLLSRLPRKLAYAISALFKSERSLESRMTVSRQKYEQAFEELNKKYAGHQPPVYIRRQTIFLRE